MSLSEASFIVALVATGGIVAWIGDIVGYRLGKRRVSLFGIRPRTTALLIGICAGALVSIVTITALSLTSRHVRTALFEMDQLSADLDTLRQRTDDQRLQIEQHKQAAEAAQSRAAEAQTKKAAATARVRGLEADIERRRGELNHLRADLAGVQRLQKQTEARKLELETRALSLERTIRTAEDDLGKAQSELARQRAVLAYVSSGLRLAHFEEPIIAAQEELARAAIDTGQPTPDVRAAVMRVLEQASAYAAEKGARPGDNGRAVLYFVIPLEAAPQESVPEEQAVKQFVAALVEREHKSYVVRAIARSNAWRAEQAIVMLEGTENRLVFAGGEVAGAVEVDSSLPDAKLWEAIMALLTVRVRAQAQAKRMLTVPNEAKYGSIRVPEVFAAMEAIHARRGPVRVEAVVAGDTWTVGPLELDLRLAGVGTNERIGRSPNGARRAGG